MVMPKRPVAWMAKESYPSTLCWWSGSMMPAPNSPRSAKRDSTCASAPGAAVMAAMAAAAPASCAQRLRTDFGPFFMMRRPRGSWIELPLSPIG
jgi:hypothetical protein